MATAREQFGRVAERYAKSRAHSDKRFLERIVASARPAKGETVLDVATGPGFVGIEFAKRGLDVVGTDITLEMVNFAKQRRRQNQVSIDLVLAEASHQPFRDDSFDVAVSRLAFHHMKDPAAALQAMTRLVRPHGRIVIADLIVPEDDEVSRFHNDLEKFRDPSHVRSLKLSEWKQLFQSLRIHLERVLLSRVPLDVTEWAERAGLPPEKTPQLARMLEKSPLRARRALKVFHRGGLLFFVNSRAILVGTKQERPPVQKAVSMARKILRR